MAPFGVEKSHPSTETTSPTATPEMVLVVKFVKVVAEVVCTVIPTGAQLGAAPEFVGLGTKKHGKVCSVKASELALVADTLPVI